MGIAPGFNKWRGGTASGWYSGPSAPLPPRSESPEDLSSNECLQHFLCMSFLFTHAGRHSYPLGWGPLSCPFCRWDNWGTETPSNSEWEEVLDSSWLWLSSRSLYCVITTCGSVHLNQWKLEDIKNSVPRVILATFQCSAATCGLWLPSHARQISNISTILERFESSDHTNKWLPNEVSKNE